MKINSIQTFDIEGLKVIEPAVFGDDRGYFFETYNEQDLLAIGITNKFVQDNESKSCRNVLRGLHYQVGKPQAKLVRVMQGEVFDVAVDLRPNSPTFGKWQGVVLSGENKKMFYIPRGFAHGFCVMSDTAVFSYKCDNFWYKEGERGVIYNDPKLCINWGDYIDLDNVILSDKDKLHPSIEEAELDE